MPSAPATIGLLQSLQLLNGDLRNQQSALRRSCVSALHPAELARDAAHSLDSERMRRYPNGTRLRVDLTINKGDVDLDADKPRRSKAST